VTLQSVTFDTLPCGRVLFAAFVLLCLFSIAAVYMANKVEYVMVWRVTIIARAASEKSGRVGEVVIVSRHRLMIWHWYWKARRACTVDWLMSSFVCLCPPVCVRVSVFVWACFVSLIIVGLSLRLGLHYGFFDGVVGFFGHWDVSWSKIWPSLHSLESIARVCLRHDAITYGNRNYSKGGDRTVLPFCE